MFKSQSCLKIKKSPLQKNVSKEDQKMTFTESLRSFKVCKHDKSRDLDDEDMKDQEVREKREERVLACEKTLMTHSRG